MSRGRAQRGKEASSDDNAKGCLLDWLPNAPRHSLLTRPVGRTRSIRAVVHSLPTALLFAV
jgi:hypothetical protein